MAWQPLGRNGRSLTADRSAVTTDADGLDDKPKLHKRPVIDGRLRRSRAAPSVGFVGHAIPAHADRPVIPRRPHLSTGLGSFFVDGTDGD
jgi:hypothetical protein